MVTMNHICSVWEAVIAEGTLGGCTRLVGASKASPLMTPKPHFRPDICRYIYIYIYMFGTYVLPQISICSSKMATHLLHPGSCTLYRGGGLPPRVALCYGATLWQMVVGDK